MARNGLALKSPWGLLVMLLVLSMALAGCGSDDIADDSVPDVADSVPDEETAPDDGPQSPTQLRIAVRENPPTLAHHWGRSAFEGTILRNIHENLVGRDPVTDEPIPELAVSWEQVDPLTWRFKLRENVKFHDGSPFNAEAAAFGLEYSWSEENDFFLRSLRVTEFEFEAIDEYTLEVRTEEEDPLLLKRLWFSTIPSAQQIQEQPEAYEDTPIGTGPYRFVQWDRDQQVVVELNEDWWGFSEGHYDPEGMFDEVVFVIREDEAARVAAFRAGEVDLAERIPPLICVGDLPDDCLIAPQSDTTKVWFDSIESNPVLSDRRVREALSLTIPRELIAEQVLLGSVPAGLPISSGVTGFTDELPPMPYDPERARELLEEAEADGIPVFTTPMVIRVREGSFPANTEVLEVVHAEWLALGLSVEAVVEELSIWNEAHLTGRDDIPEGRNAIWLHKHTNDTYDSGQTFVAFYSCDTPRALYCTPELTEKINAANMLSGSERQEAFEEIWTILYNDVAFAAIAHQQLTHLMSDNVEWTPPLEMTVLVKGMSPRE